MAASTAATQTPPDSSAFLGAWRVSEYVFDPDGRFAGVVRQRRELHRLTHDRIRVTQRCTPDDALLGHPMAHFSGHYVFDLQTDGHLRQYLGPDVIGHGVSWAEGVMTGSGVWPRFGHNFESWAVLVTPDCQLTGGTFSNGTQTVANVVGIAMPETRFADAAASPLFDGPHHPADIVTVWHGQQRTINVADHSITTAPITRVYEGRDCWADVADSTSDFQLSDRDGRAELNGTWHGIARRSGWLYELAGYQSSGAALRAFDVLDAKRGVLVTLQRHYHAQQLRQLVVAVLHAKPGILS